jgi:hypothetical protein
MLKYPNLSDPGEVRFSGKRRGFKDPVATIWPTIRGSELL